ncbi:MAG: folate-binding protein YgfZ [Motiliproteus sp.]|jgi:folate-binding protein YgfZ
MPHPSWIEFLTQQGQPQDADSLSAVATHYQQDDTLLMALTQQTLISFVGPDAEKFLQGQLTCDLNDLSQERSLLGANCTHKGMVLSTARLFKQAEGALLMRLPLAMAEPALTNLKKFAVFSKVAITLADDQWTGLALMGESAPGYLAQLGIVPPDHVNEQRLRDDLIVVRVAGNSPRFELWCPASQAEQLWRTLAALAQIGNSQAWQAADIEAGLVQLGPESLETYIPQMLNLQAVDGIGFSKGCYTGQEIVARLQYRGKLKKLMYAATLSNASLSGAMIAPGTALYAGNGRSVGKVLSSVKQQQRVLLQAIIGKAAADAGDLHLGSAEGPDVSLLPLPYSIDPELFERPQR